jgi:hypothetical protein
MTQYVVVMVEPAKGDEKLSVEGQINEVFGPFYTEAGVDDWVKRMQVVYGTTRRWLIIPLSHPSVVNKLNPEGS